MSHTYEQIQSIQKELSEYAQIEGTKYGEACNILMATSNFSEYFSEEFLNAVVKEMELQLKNFKDNYKIVRNEISRTMAYLHLERK